MYPASSRSTHVILDVDQLILSGETFRIDAISVANNTASPVLVEFESSDGSFNYRSIVCPAFNTVFDRIPFIADRGLNIPAVSADVHVNITHSASGV